MKTILNATLNFGVVYVPVGVCSATSRNDISFRTVHLNCQQPIKLHTHCDMCDTDITREDTGKGFEFVKGKFVLIDEAQMAEFMAPRSRMITIDKFVPEDDVQSIMVEKSYFLQPNKALTKPYELLGEAMELEMVVGIGKASLWGKEYPVAVRADGGPLMLHMLFCHDELVSPTEILGVLKQDVSADEREFARRFIGLKRGRLESGDLTSVSRERQLQFVQALVEGRTVSMESAVEITPTLDMMSELKKSIEAAQAEREKDEVLS